MRKQSLIVGVDPGTTLGYYALDLHGKRVLSASSKLERFDEMLARLTDAGCIVAVGVDKKKAPSLARKLATKTGARLIAPPEDLGVEEKRRMATALPQSDAHERDAAAGAILAYRTLHDLIIRIAQKTAELPIGERRAIERLVLRDGSTLQDAIEALRPPAKEVSEAPLPTPEPDIRLRLARARSRLLTRHVAILQERVRRLRKALKKNPPPKPHNQFEKELRKELESLIRAQKNGHRIIPLYATLREHALGHHPFDLPAETVAVLNTPRGAIIMKAGKPIDAKGIIITRTTHLCLIDARALDERALPRNLIHDIIKEHRTKRTPPLRR